MSALDYQVGGGHYKDRAIQPVQYWMANLMGGCEASIVKYVTRWRDKGGVEDLRKARHFLALILENEAYQRLHAEQRRAFPLVSRIGIRPDQYSSENQLDMPERAIMAHLDPWVRFGDRSSLDGARKWLDAELSGGVESGALREHED